jgi:hypothetical protein
VDGLSSVKRYRLLSGVRFGPGTVLGLSAAQLAARAHLAFDPVREGVSVNAPLSFKAGEELGIETLPRAFEAVVVSLDAAGQVVATAAPAKKVAAAPAKKVAAKA